MTTRMFSTSSNAENKATSAKHVLLPRKIEVTKRPALHSIANKAHVPSMDVKVFRPITRAIVAAKSEIPLPTTKPMKAVDVAKSTVLLGAAAKVSASATAVKMESPVPMEISKVDELAEAFSNQLLEVDDVDAGDEANPQLASNYVNDIYEYMRRLEANYAVRPKYLEGQVITGRMRGILVDWLAQVNRRFELLPETFYLSVNILDRYMQQCNVAKNKLQLVGVTSLFIAAKYEEIYALPSDELAYITDRAYTKAEILRMEVIMLKQLDFSFGCPLPLHFLRRASKAGRVDVTVHTLAKYLTELTVVEYNLVHHRPSQIAAAALYLALAVLRSSPVWSNTLAHYSKYTEQELKPIAYQMAVMVVRLEKSKLQAIRNKYASRQLLEISTIEELKGEKIKAFAALAS